MTRWWRRLLDTVPGLREFFATARAPIDCGGGFCPTIAALTAKRRANPGDGVQLARVIAGEADHEMREAAGGVTRESVGGGVRGTAEPRLVVLHQRAAAGVIGLDEFADARLGARRIVINAHRHVHRAVERVVRAI